MVERSEPIDPGRENGYRFAPPILRSAASTAHSTGRAGRTRARPQTCLDDTRLWLYC
jgi:hypothetical protein